MYAEHAVKEWSIFTAEPIPRFYFSSVTVTTAYLCLILLHVLCSPLRNYVLWENKNITNEKNLTR